MKLAKKLGGASTGVNGSGSANGSGSGTKTGL